MLPCGSRIGAVLLVVLAAAPALAGEERISVTIRAYNLAEISQGHIATAERTVRRIFDAANLALRWRSCRMKSGPGRSAADACADAIGSLEIAIRIVRAPADYASRPHSLGFAYVPGDGTAPWLATVFADRLQVLADRHRLDLGTLLGRAMAHESGHLLQATNTHRRAGLMRAAWADPTLRLRDQWLFTRDDTREMHLQARARIAAGAPPPSHTALDAFVASTPAPRPR
jgi:hypothetical protein